MKNHADTKNPTSTKVKTWSKTRHSNLWRHESGYYYIRASVGGKQKWSRNGATVGKAFFHVFGGMIPA
jgi:hypothetical protein